MPLPLGGAKGDTIKPGRISATSQIKSKANPKENFLLRITSYFHKITNLKKSAGSNL